MFVQLVQIPQKLPQDKQNCFSNKLVLYIYVYTYNIYICSQDIFQVLI